MIIYGGNSKKFPKMTAEEIRAQLTPAQIEAIEAPVRGGFALAIINHQLAKITREDITIPSGAVRKCQNTLPDVELQAATQP